MKRHPLHRQRQAEQNAKRGRPGSGVLQPGKPRSGGGVLLPGKPRSGGGVLLPGKPRSRGKLRPR